MLIGHGGEVLISRAAETSRAPTCLPALRSQTSGITMMHFRVDLPDLLGEAEQCRAFVLAKGEVGPTSGS
jgi:hypothetical protein